MYSFDHQPDKGEPMKPTWESDCGTVKLWLGDCLEVMASWPDGAVDAVVTDPPYGHNNNNGDLISRREAALGRGEYVAERDDRPIANDGEEANEIYRDCLPHWRRILQPGCCCCCCGGGGGPDPQFARWSLWMDEVFRFKQMVVWDKGPMGMGWHYRRSYETVLVGEVPGAAVRWNGGRVVENIIRPGQWNIKKIIPAANQHPCAKPVKLYEAFIRWHSDAGDVVADSFMGEGPCGVAAVRLGRQFWGVEIDPGYFETAKRRIQDELAKVAFLEPQPTVEQGNLFAS